MIDVGKASPLEMVPPQADVLGYTEKEAEKANVRQPAALLHGLDGSSCSQVPALSSYPALPE